MNYYATKIEEKEEKRFFKTVKVKIAHSRMGRRDDIVTLDTPKIKKKFWKLLQKKGINVGKKHIDVGTRHTFPPPLVEDEKKEVWMPISPSKKDLIKKHVFFQLVGIPVAKLANIENEMDINRATGEFIGRLVKKGVGEKIRFYDLDDMRMYDYGYLLPEYEKFAELAKEYADKIAWAYRIHIKDHTGTDIMEHTPLIAEIAKVAADLANHIGEHLAKRGDLPEDLEDNEYFKKYVDLLSEIFPSAEPEKPKFPETKKAVEEELRKAKAVRIYEELERKGIPKDVAEKLVEKAHLLSSREVEEFLSRHVDTDPRKARALLEAMERSGKLVPVPKYWANIVSKIATGEIKEHELLEALAVSKVFHTAYSKAIAKAAEMDEPENTMQRMMFIKKVLNEAHRETMEALKDHHVYGKYIQRKAPAIEQEMKEVAETLSKTYYAKARGDPSLSAREFLQMELNPTVETLAPLRKHLKKVNEDFLAMGRPQEETIGKVYPEMVGHLTRLGMSPFAEKEYVGITHRHEQIRKKLKEIK